MPVSRRRAGVEPAHATGKRHLELPADMPAPRAKSTGKGQRDQPWVPKSGLIGRSRRSARRG